VCTAKIKGWKTLLKLNPTPLQIKKNQHIIKGAQSKRGFVPFDLNKKSKNWGYFGKIGFRVGWG
jgi:hypothetical protein